MAVTPNYSWPVPVATDYVKDGWEAISDLGNAIDTTVAAQSPGMTLITKSTFTTQSTITFDNCFSATYTNYLIKINLTAISANSYLYHYFRSNAPADITTNYYSTYNLFYSGTSISGTAGDALFIPQFQAVVPHAAITLSCDYPMSTNSKWLYGSWSQNTALAGGQFIAGTGACKNTNATPAAGIKFYTSTGTISGTIRIYGLKD